MENISKILEDLSLSQKLENLILNSRGPEQFKAGQERLYKYIYPLVQEIQKHKILKIITIAGTNGKGESAHCLYHLLKAKGLKVGLWTSPHILLLNERFIGPDGVMPMERLVGPVEKFLKENQFKELSYYEFLFVIFLNWVKDLELDVLVLEVGLGGRLDAVNLFDASVAAITSIGRDHLEILGPRLETVLGEKASVTRSGGKLISALESIYLQEKLELWIQGNRPGLFWVDLFKEKIISSGDNFSLRNKIMAFYLAREILPGMNWEEAKEILGALNLRGRMQRVTALGGTFILVGSHNPQGIRELLKGLGPQETMDCVLLGFSDRPLGDWEAMRSMMKRQFGEKVYFACYPHPKAQKFAAWAKQLGSEKVLKDVSEFLVAMVPGQKKNILVTGSYYFIGHCLRQLLHYQLTHRSGSF